MYIVKWYIIVLLAFATQVKAVTPRTLPQEQAVHFCRLLCDFESQTSNLRSQTTIYPLSVYARRLTMLLCHDTRYGSYSAEQVFTGLIFYYDDWVAERLPYSNGEGRYLMEELHSGHTLRLFPHVVGGRATWYAPTDQLPASLGTEHQKYVSEAFPRLNALVQANDWKAVDTFIDRMIRYQCKFGGGT